MTERIHSNQSSTEILVVEDSPTQGRKVQHILEQEGYQVVLAMDGEQALVRMQYSVPALVLSDIVMPVINGYELCRRIRANVKTEDIPVILLTALSDEAAMVEGLACGASGFVTKPYSPGYLLRHIKKTLADAPRSHDRAMVSFEVPLVGGARSIVADPRRMVSLLFSAYEAAVQQNAQLVQAERELDEANSHLEDIVAERTATLAAKIAEHEKTAMALHASDARWKALADNSPDVIMTLNAEFEIVFINRDAPGLGREDVLGAPLPAGTKELRDTIDQTLSRVLATGTSEEFESFIDEPAGGRFFFENRVQTMTNGPDDEVLLLTSTDVTDRKQSEDTVAQRDRAALELSELARGKLYSE